MNDKEIADMIAEYGYGQDGKPPVEYFANIYGKTVQEYLEHRKSARRGWQIIHEIVGR